MFSFFLILSFFVFSNAFYIRSKSPSLMLIKSRLHCHKHNVQRAIQIFNIIDIIQPNSITKFIQYKLFFKNAYYIFLHNFKEDFYEMNLNFSLNLFVFSICGLFLFYLYTTKLEEINKISLFEKEKDTDECLYRFDILISFISYFLFKDVLSAC